MADWDLFLRSIILQHQPQAFLCIKAERLGVGMSHCATLFGRGRQSFGKVAASLVHAHFMKPDAIEVDEFHAVAVAEEDVAAR